MSLTVQNLSLYIFNMRTRMPFKYGIATMTALPHVFIQLSLTLDGKTQIGLAADHLPPKWFTKDPDTAFTDDILDMLNVIQTACAFSQDIAGETIFELWRELYALQSTWALDENYPPLLWNFGVSLVERALIDAFCKATGLTFTQVVHDNRLGVNLGEIHAELAGQAPADFLSPQPLPHLIARHTVGLGDPLTDAEIPAAERLNDGLPQSLAACIEAYGQTHFKLKLFGDPDQDIDRLSKIAQVIEARSVSNYAFTLDGNEQYKTIAPFKSLWQALKSNPNLQNFLSHLLFIEQPLHRDEALSQATQEAMQTWVDRPPIIIDESDAELSSLPTALACGYVGTSHKNCKGIFKGLANVCLIERYRRTDAEAAYLISGEDLSNVGPVALLQDCVVMSVLGVDHVERNSHHYFSGLSMFPQDLQEAMLAQHGDFYHRHPDEGYPTLNIQQGKVAVGSLLAAPFGLALDFDPSIFTPVDEWDVTSL